MEDEPRRNNDIDTPPLRWEVPEEHTGASNEGLVRGMGDAATRRLVARVQGVANGEVGKGDRLALLRVAELDRTTQTT